MRAEASGITERWDPNPRLSVRFQITSPNRRPDIRREMISARMDHDFVLFVRRKFVPAGQRIARHHPNEAEEWLR